MSIPKISDIVRIPRQTRRMPPMAAQSADFQNFFLRRCVYVHTKNIGCSPHPAAATAKTAADPPRAAKDCPVGRFSIVFVNGYKVRFWVVCRVFPALLLNYKLWVLLTIFRRKHLFPSSVSVNFQSL